ncbi:unnamed protein product [marine sediment metagenome]|uniref:Uncharacterized protein n=1 Tax=marine sediment metagenome TaxID=412755 RepID=X0WPT5_9ZZZZ
MDLDDIRDDLLVAHAAFSVAGEDLKEEAHGLLIETLRVFQEARKEAKDEARKANESKERRLEAEQASIEGHPGQSRAILLRKCSPCSQRMHVNPVCGDCLNNEMRYGAKR